MLAENSFPQAPTHIRNIQTGKSKKLFLSVGNAPSWQGSLDHIPLLS